MDIEIYGQNELIERIGQNKNVTSHLISIGNPSVLWKRDHRQDTNVPKIFKETFKSILRIEFFDVLEKEHLGNMRPKRIPLKRDVKKAIRYFKKHSKNANGFTIHCWRGVSRSTAIALGYLYLIHGDEQKAVDALKKIRPDAGPHPGLVKFFDEILGCDLTSFNDQLRDIRMRELKEWFFNEIDDIIEELEPVDDDLMEE